MQNSAIKDGKYRKFEDIKRWKDIELVNVERITHGDAATLERLLPQVSSISVQEASESVDKNLAKGLDIMQIYIKKLLERRSCLLTKINKLKYSKQVQTAELDKCKELIKLQQRTIKKYSKLLEETNHQDEGNEMRISSQNPIHIDENLGSS